MSDANPDQKKDLTDLMDYAKNLEANGQSIPVPKGSVMEELVIEKVADFESLEEYGKHNPTPEPPTQEDPFVTTPDAPSDANWASAPEAAEIPSADPLLDLPPPQEFEAPQFEPSQLEPSQIEPSQIEAPQFEESQFEAPPLDPPPAEDFSIESPQELDSRPPEPFAIQPPSKAPSAPEEIISEKLRPAHPGSSIPPSAIARVRDYSERAITQRAPAQASYPFSLMITGRLAPEEQSRLIDLVARENLGIREIDLEPMLASGRVLIPRISEYAGIVIVAALRTARAKIRMGPSDEIFATEDTQDETPTPPPLSARGTRTDGLFPHAAEELPVTTESVLAELPGLVVIDVISASAILETREVEAERSSEYQEILEALQRELKYKAFRRGARALLNFTIKLTVLRAPTQYRLTVLASAVR